MNIILLASILQVLSGALAVRTQVANQRGSIGELLDIFKNETKIWLYKRTNRTNNHTCLYWQKTWIGGASNCNFTEYYVDDDGKPHISKLHGTVTSRPRDNIEGAALQVPGVSEAGYNVEYVLVNWNSSDHCGIFYTQNITENYRQNQTCGLYFGDAAVNNKTLIDKCEGGYKHYCNEYKKEGQPEQTLYSEKCLTPLAC
ncbi:uncharacterized protein LOC142784589 isoform X1 [Rhipicephalus microplus]|uniref:uncharacterized protein LOC142784589 isoform X1 n=1 Tax=Rhipicephalus microplus TaxID=6941 RepID=UPI003F6B2F9A